MTFTGTQMLSASRARAMHVLAIMLITAAVTAQTPYLELTTTGSVVPPSGLSRWSISADFNNNGTDDVFYMDGYAPWCMAIMDPGVNGFGVAVSGSLSFPGGPASGFSWGFAAELTGDGNSDVVLFTTVGLMAVLYPGTGTGAFPASAASVLPVTMPTGVIPLDIDNNGVLDLVCLQSNVLAASSLVFLQNQYPVWTTLSIQSVPDVMVIDSGGDCDGDGNKDVLLRRVNANNQIECTVLWGLGNGAFAPLAPWGTSSLPFYALPGGCYPASRWVGDVNSDGRTDVLVTQYCVLGPLGQGGPTWHDQVYLGQSNRTFTPGGIFMVPASYGATSSSSVGHSGLHDMDLDGSLDLVCNPMSIQLNPMQTAYLSQISILIARGTGGSLFDPVPFTASAPQITNTFGTYPSMAHVSDFDNDGDLDVLAANVSAPQQFYFCNRSSRGTGCPGTLGAPVLSHGLANVGNTLHSLSVSGAAPNAAAVIAVSLGMNANPLNTCGVYIDNLASTLYLPSATSALGTFNWPMPIPNNPLLHGVPFFAQAAVLDPTGPNLGGLNLALTPARTIIVW